MSDSRPDHNPYYVAKVVLQIIVDGDARSVIHINTLLLEAESPDQAYDAAIDLGRGAEMHYQNPDGQQVRITFRGLRHSDVLHDPLELGAEIMFEKKSARANLKLKHY